MKARKYYMMKKVKNDNRKGFTLIDVLAAMVIIAIITSISYVVYINTINNSREKSLAIAQNNVKKSAEVFSKESSNINWIKLNKDRQYAKFDWSLITDEENQGFIYDMYSSCAASGSSHIACIIQKDKYCWRYYVPHELENEIGEKYRNKEVVDIRQLEPFTGWRGYK